MTKLLNSTSKLTIFLPVDSAWDVLDPYERLYLESEYSANDLNRILNLHAVVEEGVDYSDTFEEGTDRKALFLFVMQCIYSLNVSISDNA